MRVLAWALLVLRASADLTLDVSCNNFATSYSVAACCGKSDDTLVTLELPLSEVRLLNQVQDATSLAVHASG